MRSIARIACVGLLLAPPAFARDFERELSADRPDTTESPYTVEAGAFQVESSLWAYGKDRADGVKVESWALAETNLKFGLNPSMDLQLVLRPWVSEKESGEDFTRRSEGTGDIDLRLKWNAWGNDGGKTAGGLMGYVTIPSGTAVSDEDWQAGLIFPVAVELNETFSIGMQVELARVLDDGGHVWDVLHSAVCGIALSESVGLFIEYVGVTGERTYEASAYGGITWAVGENLQWDIALGAGLNGAAEDFSVAQGVTFRF